MGSLEFHSVLHVTLQTLAGVMAHERSGLGMT